MSRRMRSLAPTMIAALVVAGSVASLLPLPSDVLAQLSGENVTRGSALLKCQETLEKESAKQQAKERKSLSKCLLAARRDKLVGGTNVTTKTAETCRKELVRVNDSQDNGSSWAAKARAAMLKACNPSGPTPKPYTEADVLEVMVAGLEGLGGKNLEPAFASLNVTSVSAVRLNSTANLVEYVVAENTKASHASLKGGNPKASIDLRDAATAIVALPPPSDGTDANDRASKAATEAAYTLDPDGDGIPAPSIPFAAAARIVFVSSTTETGNFSGFNNAKELCDSLASSADLPGDFIPWVSDPSSLAPDKLFSRTSKPGIPYFTVTGRVVANETADFVNGSLVSPINVDENGALVSDAPVWTGTDALGDNALPNCNDFNSSSGGESGVIGRTSRSDAGWSNTGTPQTCDQPARIYCIEVDSDS